MELAKKEGKIAELHFACAKLHQESQDSLRQLESDRQKLIDAQKRNKELKQLMNFLTQQPPTDQ